MRQGGHGQRRETNRTSGGRTAGVGPCPNAGLLQVAVARNGLGAVAWRSVRWPEPEVQRFSVQASDLADGRFGAPRSVSTGRAWYGQHALVAGGARALLVWRDRARSTRSGQVLGRVLGP